MKKQSNSFQHITLPLHLLLHSSPAYTRTFIKDTLQTQYD